jgi:hypothetical protein
MDDKITKNGMGGGCSTMEKSRSLYGVLAGKPEDPDPGLDGRILLKDGICRPRLD